MAKVTMPQLGESVAEGTIGKWLKQPGDRVAKYEPLLEVITDKVNAEVPSPFEGVLTEILVEEGATVPNNAEIAVIETAEEGTAGASAAEPARAAAPPAASAVPPAPATSAVASTTAAKVEPAHGPAGSDERPERAAASAPPAPSTTATQPALPGDPNARMTPAVRRLLREHSLEPAHIVGTGGGGRITREDVLDFVEAQRTGKAVNAQQPAPVPSGAAATGLNGTGAPAGRGGVPAAAPSSSPSPAAARPAPGPAGATIAFPDGSDEVLLPMTQMRKGIAAQMTRALQIPHAYVHMEVDAANLVRLRTSQLAEYKAREGTSLSYVPFVVKAAVEALKRHGTFNAQWTDQGVLAKRRVNVGVAVAVDEGLIVPVVRDVDQLSINGINHAIADVAARARANKLRVDDFGGGTFTVDNTGWFGSNLTMPIINAPEVAILTMEAITKRPVVLETPAGDVIAIRPVMNMVMGIDHRANDGAQAAAFLRDIKSWLEAVGPETAIY
ncbi:MAG TPA: dihydrolipoamide acetyltransferase family protein [Candidatus Dormibacteraeota bacterium]|nr:dihydrolipoamide acetyltransferase family protein [Candidatus Dormibacteraeota bacterium]